jgi:hydroxyethylthiazole kinase-like uncharacterized protein yjeF
MAQILTTAEMAARDAAAVAAGTPRHVLMERAGAAVADAVRARFSPRPVVVWCGPGDNGGDGYVAARLLRKRGWTVRVEALAAPNTADAKFAASRWRGETRPLTGALTPAGLYIDALFGAGLARPLDGAAQALARAAAGAAAPIVAIDLPSGFNGDTAKPVGEDAFTAALTVTFHRRKIVHVLTPGHGACGEVVVADIGLPDGGGTGLTENLPSLWADRMPWPKETIHKHRRGRLGVVGGGATHTGAARLAARAGLRVGAGLVTVLSPPDAVNVYAAALEAVMVRVFENEAALTAAAETLDAAVIGPAAGVGETTVRNLLALVQTGAALVVDADALTSFRADPSSLFSALDRDDVLTPHEGEFERIFPGLLAAGPHRVVATQAAAKLSGTIVLLKGADSVIAAPDGRTAVNLNGSPWLATAGSGDVLCGFIAGLIAQGMDSFDAVCAAVWIHGECAASFGPGLIAEDLPGLTPAVLAGLFARRPGAKA